MYPICSERDQAALEFATRKQAEAWLKKHLGKRVFLQLTPNISYLEATLDQGVITDRNFSEAVGFYALTDAGIHQIYFRDIDSTLVADVSAPRADATPPAPAKSKRKK